MPGVPRITGRKKKPTALKLITGNPGHRTLNAEEPAGPAGEPVAPDWLDELALAKWNEVLEWCHWITPADGDMLALYCDAYSRYQKAQKLAIQSPVLKATDGRLFKNPAATALNECFTQMRSAGSELGLSPSARSGVTTGREKRDKITEKYFD